MKAPLKEYCTTRVYSFIGSHGIFFGGIWRSPSTIPEWNYTLARGISNFEMQRILSSASQKGNFIWVKFYKFSKRTKHLKFSWDKHYTMWILVRNPCKRTTPISPQIKRKKPKKDEKLVSLHLQVKCLPSISNMEDHLSLLISLKKISEMWNV